MLSNVAFLQETFSLEVTSTFEEIGGGLENATFVQESDGRETLIDEQAIYEPENVIAGPET